MPDHREPVPARRPRAFAGPPAEAASPRPSRAEAIEAVSHLLSRKKPATDRLATPSPAPLPKFPRALGADASAWRKPPSLRAKFDGSAASVELPPVRWPDGGSPAPSASPEPPPGEGPEAGPTPSSMPSSPFVGSSPSVARVSATSIPSAPERVARGPEAAGFVLERDGPGSGFVSPSEPVRVGGEDPGPRGGLAKPDGFDFGEIGVRRSGPGPVGVVSMVRIADPVGSPGVDRVSPIGPSRGLSVWEGSEASRRSPAPDDLGEASGVSAIPRAGDSPITVRNPFLPGSAGFMAPREFPGSVGVTRGPDDPGIGMGLGSGGPPSAGVNSTGGGGGVDLSKTNELLRQLLEAVKRQRDTSLPVGGSSVAPVR